MIKWYRLPQSVRAGLALALLALLLHATAAAAGDCIAVDMNDLPRDCTLSEQLGSCGWNAYDSWVHCVDTDDDGWVDVGWWGHRLCDGLAALDLMACSVWVPWEVFKF
ncbi:MAG TPA: hypothetical protein VGA70_15090 [Longimicrobiales bacterium]